MDRYESVARRVKLLGPTSFAPLVRKAIEIVRDSGRRYHCLVIIADGQVTSERETVKAIQEASSYPLSIIMVGVGEGPWDTCRVFDNRLPGRYAGVWQVFGSFGCGGLQVKATFNVAPRFESSFNFNDEF